MNMMVTGGWLVARAMFLVGCLVLLVSASAITLRAQSETATISGLVTDEGGGMVPNCEVVLQSIERGTLATAKTNDAGIYVFAGVQPGQYNLTIKRGGFKQVDFLGLIVNVQDHIEQNFRLQVGSISESVTVEASGLNINTTDATVSTVVDRQFAENLPLNGRSFQTLIELTPGVVLTASTVADGGQFSVNGQRAVSNYWTVDGVSANFGIGAAGLSPGNGSAGSLPSFSVLGGTNSLVSVDALQEFRIQTSTYAPEFGRTPGGQISIVTRSGTSQFHGTAFDYLRNDKFDANDWFANATSQPKPEERQNDFGGTFSGPIVKGRTFFFFSYEGLRLRLPQTTLTCVPDANPADPDARQNATPAMQPYLNAYPLPNGPQCKDVLGNSIPGAFAFNASYSDPASLDAYSLRIDHQVNKQLTLFGRYNYSPSRLDQRGNSSLSAVSRVTSTTQTATVGMTWSIFPTAVNDLRFNYSRADGENHTFLDNFRGAVPLTSLPLPSPFTGANANFEFSIGPLTMGGLNAGLTGRNLQRQINITDSLSVQKGSHSLKFGFDFRRLSPVHDPSQYLQQVFFSSVAAAEAGNPSFAFLQSATTSALLFHNLGVFAQDTWRIAPRLTVTYGLRWDIDFAPSTTSGPSLLAVTGFNLTDLSQLALAPAGTTPFQTTYGNVAPRVGVAYQLSQTPDWQTVVRGGFGVFYDLVTSQTGNVFGTGLNYPFGGFSFCSSPNQTPSPNCPDNLTFPLSPSVAAAPPITSSAGGTIGAVDPNLKMPYALEWNVAFEQALGKQQTISASYIGSVGRRLLQSAYIAAPNPSFGAAQLVGNTGTSDYHALQIQYQRRLSYGLQALASYSWSHSIDTGSTGSFDNAGNTLQPGGANQNRGPSDFDIRNSVSAGVTYDIPGPKINAFTSAILRGWSLESIIQARSAPPEDISYQNTFNQTLKNNIVNIRPDVVPGQPLYLYGPQFPGGKAFNPAAFTPPPADANGNPVRQGDFGRNTLRGFGATQWDFAVHRDFPIHEALKLQFRAEMFNVVNHPNFALPFSIIDQGGGFGIANQMLGRSLTDVTTNGGLNPLYQIGGPRSIQFGLKLIF